MKKQFLWTVLWVFTSGGAWAAPVTAVSVSHPKTNTTVTHPTTAVAVSHPRTVAPVTHPKTTVTVTRPQTSVPVSHPTTNAPVSHPTTSVPVTHPQTTATSSDKSAAPEPTKQAVDNSATAPAAQQKGSMMSNYQAPKAKDFKAAKLGGGEQGLGKTNEAEKDAAAASLKPPKALEFEDTANSNLKSKLTEKVKEKTK